MNVYFILFLGVFAFIEVQLLLLMTTSIHCVNCKSRKSKSLGTCPKLDVSTACVVDYKFNCLFQKQCPSGYRCCTYGCNRRCAAVTVNKKHLGSCRNSSGKKGKRCKKDKSCKRHEKCCNKRCRRVRKKIAPVRYPIKK